MSSHSMSNPQPNEQPEKIKNDESIPKISYRKTKKNSNSIIVKNRSLQALKDNQNSLNSSESSDQISLVQNKSKTRQNKNTPKNGSIKVRKSAHTRRHASVKLHKNVKNNQAQSSLQEFPGNNENSADETNQTLIENTEIINISTIEKRKIKRRSVNPSQSPQSKRSRVISGSHAFKSMNFDDEPNLSFTQRINHPANKMSLTFSPPVGVDYYFIETQPQPLVGKLISKINGIQSKFEFKQDERLQYVQPIHQFIPGPTASNHNKPSHKTSKTPKKESFVIEKDDFDDFIHFSPLDFGTNYISSIDDNSPLITNKTSSYSPNFYTFNIVPSYLIEKLKQNEIVRQVIRILYDNREPLMNLKGFNLTNCLKPNDNDITYLTSGNSVYIDLISPAAFYDFRFGDKITAILPDKFHLFVWHNLGIPSALIAKNLEIILRFLNTEQMMNVIQYVFLWLYYYPDDFSETIETSNIIQKLMKKLVSRNSDLVLCQAAIIRAIVHALKTKAFPSDFFCIKCLSPNLKTLYQITDLMELNIDPSVIVDHFTYIDIEMLKSIKTREFVRDNWKQKSEMSPNINKIIDRFNEVSSFIATSILVDNEEFRARIISFWIQAMNFARNNRNYHLLAEIDAALSCLPIKRLKSTWKRVDQRYLTMYKSLNNFFDRKESKIEMMESPKITMPFIGLFLIELSQFFDDPKMKSLPSGEEGYNLSLHRKYYNIVNKIFLDWGNDLRFNLDIKLLEECKVLSGRAKSPQDLILPSIGFESPRPNEKRFIEEYLKQC